MKGLIYFNDFVDATVTCWKKAFEYKGRAKRAEHNWFIVFTSIVGLIAVVLDPPTGMYDQSMLANVVNLVTAVPSLAVSVRRLHDVNKSGWWLLLMFTIVGIIPIIYWTVFKNSVDENK